jgi:HEAT repeat protein
MNPKRITLFGTVWGCLMLAGLAAQAAEVSVTDAIGNLKSADEALRLQAIDELGAKGKKAAEAVAPLTALLTDVSPTVRAHAATALGEIGESARPAVPALAKLINDSDKTVRRQAVQAIVRAHPGPKVMVPLLVKSLEDGDPGVRMRILQAIADQGEKAVPGLIVALKSDKAAYWACLALREIGPAGKDAVPALIERLKDKRPEVRREAILTLAVMGDAALPAVGPIAASLDDEAMDDAAIYALARIGKVPADTEARIKTIAKSDDKMLSTASLWALARIHPEDKELRREVGEQLVSRLKDEDPLVRVAAARALTALPPAPEIMVPIWEKAFEDADETVVLNALDALAQLGAPAVPRLIAALKHENIRVHVVYVLGQIGPVAAPATEALAKLIDNEDEEVAHEAVLALAKIGPGAKAAVPALIKAIDGGENTNAAAIAYALGKIGPDAMEAEPVLSKLLKIPDENLALASAWALAKIHPASAEIAKNTVPLLTAGLTDELPLIRHGAAEALGALGDLAKDALPALQKATSDTDKAVGEAATEAIKQIGGSAAK